MIKNVTALEKMLKLEAGTLQQAIESQEEVEVSIPELVVRTKEEQSTYESNLDSERKAKYDDGVEVGEKRGVKSAMEKFGINLDEKAKTVDNFAEAFKAKIIEETGKEPSQKIQELQNDNEKLRTNYTALESDFNTFKQDVTLKQQAATIDKAVNEAIPDNNLLIGKDEISLIFKNRFDLNLNESGNLEIKKDGEVLKNTTTLNPLGVTDVMNDFIKPYVKVPEGGTGEGDKIGDKKSSYDSFVTEMGNKGIREGSAEFQREANQRQKDGTLEL